MEKIEQSYKKSKNIIGIIQSCLILLLIVLIIFIMVNISRLQGTARVINYAGLVRGATQREVKLEITGNPDDELIKYLDDVLNDLKYQNGQYKFFKNFYQLSTLNTISSGITSPSCSLAIFSIYSSVL